MRKQKKQNALNSTTDRKNENNEDWAEETFRFEKAYTNRLVYD